MTLDTSAAKPSLLLVLKESLNKFPKSPEVINDLFGVVDNYYRQGNLSVVKEFTTQFWESTGNIVGLSVLTKEQAMFAQAALSFSAAVANADVKSSAQFAIGLVDAPVALKQLVVKNTLAALSEKPNDKSTQIRTIIDVLNQPDNNSQPLHNRIDLLLEIDKGLQIYPGDQEIVKIAKESIITAMKIGDFGAARAISEVTLQNIGDNVEIAKIQELATQSADMLHFRSAVAAADWSSVLAKLKTDYVDASKTIGSKYQNVLSQYIKLSDLGGLTK